MSMISEQINKLREAVKSYRPYVPYYVIGLLHNAADTIESLSAKLKEADCGGGWIYCGDGNNLPEIERDIILSTRSLDVYKGYRANTEGYFYAEGEGYILYENVLAWMPQPKPYHEP